MKRSRFTEEKIIGVLKELAAGLKVADACRKYGVSQFTIYAWKKKYQGFSVSEAKRLRALEDENRTLKVLTGESDVGQHGLEGCAVKKLVEPAVKRPVVSYLQKRHGYSQRRACGLVALGRSTCQYAPRPDRNGEIREALRQAASERPRWGQDRLHVLLRRRGHAINHKRTERLYREMKLALRLRKRRKRASGVRVITDAPTHPNERWSMDFVHDQLVDGRRIKCLTLVDDFSRECLAIAVDTTITGEGVIRVLERVAMDRPLPPAIVCDNGPEFASTALDRWAYEHSVRLAFIEPGKPVQNPYIESFNGKFRDECLSENLFFDLRDARFKIETWRQDYNHVRPHRSLAQATPVEFAHNQKRARAETELVRL